MKVAVNICASVLPDVLTTHRIVPTFLEALYCTLESVSKVIQLIFYIIFISRQSKLRAYVLRIMAQEIYTWKGAFAP